MNFKSSNIMKHYMLFCFSRTRGSAIKIWSLRIFVITALSLSSSTTRAQLDSSTNKDSTSITGQAGLMGRWQTGNLNQLSLRPYGYLSISQVSYFAEINSVYHVLKVNGIKVKNDFWNYGLIQYKPSRKVFPSIHGIIGFAESYQIDHSVVLGTGAGVNFYKKSLSNYLQLHLFGAYLSFKYSDRISHNAAAIGSLVKSRIPLLSSLDLQWEFSSFHSLRENTFWGFGNLASLRFKLTESLGINITHQTYFNNETPRNFKSTNTEMLFGIQYSFNNN